MKQAIDLSKVCPIKILFALALLIVPLSAHAEQGEDTVKALIKIFTTWSGSSSDRAAYAEAARYIDYQQMSARVLGPAYWSHLSGSQRTKFIESFQQLIEKRYYPRWHRLFHNSEIAFLGEKEVSGEVCVKTQLRIGSSPEIITWTLDKSGGDKVVDLQVNERDLVRRTAKRFQKRLSKSNFNDLLAWIHKQTTHLSPDSTATEHDPTS